jgi:hypothetical protein
MKTLNEKSLELEHDEFDLLVWNIANEVINGFKVGDFDRRIGTSFEDFKDIAIKLRAVPAVEAAVLSLHEATVFKNALAITLEELGEDEFETRTGYSFEKGNLVLKSLRGFTS